MKAVTRPYAVIEKATGKMRLIEATHPANALRLVAETSFSVAVATTADVASIYEAGGKIERLKSEQLHLPGVDDSVTGLRRMVEGKSISQADPYLKGISERDGGAPMTASPGPASLGAKA